MEEVEDWREKEKQVKEKEEEEEVDKLSSALQSTAWCLVWELPAPRHLTPRDKAGQTPAPGLLQHQQASRPQPRNQRSQSGKQ